MVVFFTGLVDRNPASPDVMTEFFFARGLDTIQGRDASNGGWIILLLGSLFAAYVMYRWWRDVAKESVQGDHTPVVDIGLRYGMILFIMQEVMFFVGWFWMFFEIGLFHKVRTGWNTDILENAEGYGNWPPPDVTTIDPWHLPLMNTLVLLLSGTTVTWAHHALINGNRKGAKWGLGLTILLGIFFTLLQGIEYVHAFDYREDGAFWLSTNVYGSAFFLATGFHGLHVVIGTIFLLAIWLRLMNGGLKPEKHFGLEAAAWYWHFVDVVWLFLFAFVYVVFQ
ncbi:MAG: cytochrome c oxidase subunit 3 [Hyphomonadaceae bacterium]|nr:cytochrome c oxidase subunit 3 [Hyphomonadaceae bacterium]MBC6411453.1 cytochrome c oxidase subunit 3 [Hyphomonadaceae bacterium]